MAKTSAPTIVKRRPALITRPLAIIKSPLAGANRLIFISVVKTSASAGINVSRAIRQLGGQSTALIAIGGATGAHLLQLLALEGVATVAFQGPGETRQSVTVNEDDSGAQYRFVLSGPTCRIRGTLSTTKRVCPRSKTSLQSWPNLVVIHEANLRSLNSRKASMRCRT